MLLRASPPGLEVWAPAKLNLFLEVVSKRADGFHEIETLMTPIDLYDTLYFQEAPGGGMELDCRWASHAARPAGCRGVPLPQDRQNIVVRGLELLRAVHGIQAGAKLLLVKRIPIAAGLAGGSSDAAAALVAANIVWKLGLSRDELAALAARVGSDVPFFLQRGAAVCRGRGEQIEPLTGLAPLHFAVAYPPQGLGTAEVYGACRPSKTVRHAGELVAAWRVGKTAAVGRLLHNQLEPAAAGLSPWVRRLKQEFARQGTLGAQMSGSGTSYFGLCRTALHARQVSQRLRMRGLGHVYTARTCG